MHLAHHQELCRLYTEILPREGGGGANLGYGKKRGAEADNSIVWGSGGATPYTCYAGMLKKFVVSLF